MNDASPHRRNFVPQGVGQSHGFVPHLSRFCPAVFTVGQNRGKLLINNEKTACPTWDKGVGQTRSVTHLSHHTHSLGSVWWDKNLGQLDYMEDR